MRSYVEAMTATLCDVPCPSEPNGWGRIELDAKRVLDIYGRLDPGARGQAETYQARFSRLMADLGEVYAEAQKLIADVQSLSPAGGDDGDLDDQDDPECDLPEYLEALPDDELSVVAEVMRSMSDAVGGELHKRHLPASE